MLVNHRIRIITETIWYLCVQYFPIMSYFKALKLIHICIECMHYLHNLSQHLVVEYNYHELAVFIVEICFVGISCFVLHIYTLLICSILHKWTFEIRSYTVSNHIHLYVPFLIWNMRHRKLTHIVIISARSSHLVYVPIRA